MPSIASNTKTVYCLPRNRDLIPLSQPNNFTLVEVVDDQVKLEWDHVPNESVRGQFQGYVVRIWNNKRSVEYAVPNHVHTLLVDFFPYSRNFLTVAVRNNKFVGPLSETIVFDAPQTAPHTPMKFEVTQIGANSVMMSWTRPEPNGILLGYRIICQEIVHDYKLREEIIATAQVNNPDIFTTKLTGMQPGRKYRITIYAANCVGESLGRYKEIEIKAHDPVEPSIPELEVRVNYTEEHILQNCNELIKDYDSYFESLTSTNNPSDFDFPDEELKVTKKVAYVTTGPQAQDCLVNTLVTWIPDMSSSSPGEYFYVKYKAKGETEFHETDPEYNLDYLIIKDYNSCKPHQVIVTSVDGNYTTDSDIKEVPRYKYGYM